MDNDLLDKSVNGSVKGAPVVDNFTLLFHEDEVILKHGRDDELTDEELFRKRINAIMERIMKLRSEISHKNQAKDITEDKLKMQLRDSRNQSKHFGAINTKQTNLLQAIDSNYKRLKLLYEKIYSLQVELQELYIEISDLIDKRCDHVLEIHKNSRLCATTLHEYKTQFNI